MDDTSKRFNDLLNHVKDLVGDRTLAAMKTKRTNHHNQGPQPMNIGQFDEPNLDLNAFGGKGGKGGKGPKVWGQP
eukprot:15291227-Heterocapsa_arctica.AAC.1